MYKTDASTGPGKTQSSGFHVDRWLSNSASSGSTKMKESNEVGVPLLHFYRLPRIDAADMPSPAAATWPRNEGNLE